MANVSDKKDLSLFSNELKKVEATWDFAVDGGAQGVFDMFEAKEDMVLVQAYTKVKTLVESAGAVEFIIGIKGGDTDALLQTTLKAALLADTVLDGDAASERLRVAADEIISLTIGAADATAGKIEVVLIFAKF